MSESPDSGHGTIWLNGNFTPLAEARISPLDRGFLYGDGFFETIRAENGRALYLKLHLERLHESLCAFSLPLVSQPDWERIISELLVRNKLAGHIAAVKIIVTRGTASPPGLPLPEKPTVCATAQRYDPPSSELYDKGWNLLIFKEGYAPPLAPFKSLNYLYHLSARQAALNNLCHEAILLDPEGMVTETSAGSLVARSGGRWWSPASPHCLPATTLRKLSAILEESGVKIERRPATPKRLFFAETVWVLNSLIGIMPVSHIDGHPVFDRSSAEAARLRALLFARG